MKIAIITVGELPVPNIKGGGAETLVTQILDENEKVGKIEFVVYSIENEEAESRARTYKKTKFIFLSEKKNSIVQRAKRKYIKITTGFHIPLERFSYDKIIDNIKKENVDYVLIENTMVPFYEYVKVFGKKVLIHTHWDYINNQIPEKVLKKYRQAAVECGGIITVSEYIKKRILTVDEIKKEKVHVLKNCTNIEQFGVKIDEKERNELRKQYGINNKDLLFIFTGRISQEKGVIQLVKAYKKLKEKQATKLVIVGSAQTSNTIVDEYTQKVYEEIEEIKDDVIFTGYVAHDKMPYIYKMADVAILPSTGQDPAPLTIFEAMAAGLPIITTYSGGIPEYVTKQCAIINQIDSNLVNNLMRSMDELAKNKNKRIKMGIASLERSKEFSTEKYYSDFVEIMDNIQKQKD